MRLLLSILLVSCGSALFALDPEIAATQHQFRQWSVEEGLRLSPIHAISQTHDGYLWLGTRNGLIRTDGVRFVEYDNDARIPANYICALMTDRQGTLWIGTSGGLVTMKEGRFQRVPFPGNERVAVTALSESTEGVYAATTKGLFLVRGGSIERSISPDGFPSGEVTGLAHGSDGQLWIGTAAGIAVRSRDGRFSRLTGPGLPYSGIRTFADHGDGSMWIGLDHGLMRVTSNSGGRVIERDLMPQQSVGSIVRDDRGNVWLGTNEGLYRRSALPPHKIERAEQAFDTTLAIFIDKAQNVWQGTRADGLGQLRDTPFVRISKLQGLTEKISTVLEASDGSLWFGSNAGAWRRRADRIENVAVKDGLPNNTVMALAEDRDGGIWIGTMDGAARVHRGRVTKFGRAEGLTHGSVVSIGADRDGSVVLGTLGGGAFHWINGTLRHLGTAHGLPGDRVLMVASARGGGLWISTTKNPLVLLRNGTITSPLPTHPRMNTIRQVVEDSDGTMWLGSLEHGLFRVRGRQVTRFGRRQGIPDMVLPLVDDAHGSLWFGSRLGVIRVAKSDLNACAAGRVSTVPYRRYSRTDGVWETNPGQPGALRATDGRIWFPTINGAAVIDPTLPDALPGDPHVAIEELYADGRAVNPMWNPIAPRTQHVNLRFTGLALTAPEQLRFRHKLEGFDKNWIEAGTQRTATYTNLPPGKYRFVVAGRVGDGPWFGVTASAPIERLPAYYETSWFRTGEIVALIMAVFGLARLRTSRLRKRQLQLEQIVADRTLLLREANESLHTLSLRDGLTSIANRRHFDEHLQCEWQRSARAQEPVSLLLMDVDFFKLYNDAYGHQEGDRCLRAVALAVASAVSRANDLAARYGGEEFGVILPSTNREGAIEIANKIRECVEALALPHRGSRVASHVTVSIGVSTAIPHAGLAPELLIAQADEALYAAKERGRNRVECAEVRTLRAA